jgi:CRP-like cAMP-binding protein
VDLLAGGLDAQVAALLTRQAEQGVVRLSQAVLAELLGARRTSINRVLKRFETAGWVRLGYGEVEILDPAGLLALPDRPAVEAAAADAS